MYCTSLLSRYNYFHFFCINKYPSKKRLTCASCILRLGRKESQKENALETDLCLGEISLLTSCHQNIEIVTFPENNKH